MITRLAPEVVNLAECLQSRVGVLNLQRHLKVTSVTPTFAPLVRSKE